MRKAVQSVPEDKGKHRQLASALERCGAYGEAAEEYLEILRRAPDDADAIARLSACREAAIQKFAQSSAVGLGP
jgi:uncharacterized protein YdbL (DUF1318 family)